MKKITDEILKFNKERDWMKFHNLDNLAKSICIESGELLELFQWDNDYDKEDVCDELADIMNYCILMADLLDVDIEDIILNKLHKNNLKYPVDKAYGKSVKYNKL